MRTILLDEMTLPRLEQIDTSDVLEESFKKDALRVLQRLHPTCHVFKFEPVVDLDGVKWKPDAAVLDRELGYLFVIEFERSTKSLEKHVVLQVVAFRDGFYGDDAAAMISKYAYLSVEQARSILQFVPRSVAVVVDAEVDGWRNRLTSENVQMLSISRYSQQGGRTAFFIEGALQTPVKFLGIGQVYATVPGIRIRKSAFWTPKQYVILGPSGRSTWTAIDDGAALWLLKDRGVLDLRDRAYVRFMLQEDDLISLFVI